MKTTFSIGKPPLACALLTALTGCTVYLPQPPPAQVYTPPPQPAPVYVEPAPPPEPAPAVVAIQSDDDFDAPLSPYGQWVVEGSYGRCWRPTQVDVGWRPYANGHWELTDNGWYWESDEPWAWATYHYGRWEMTSDNGWIWVPRTEWAPAWVSWRSGGGYVGWAPLPVEQPGISVDVSIAPATYCFVEEAHMHDPVRPTTVIVNNTTIINKTVIINKTSIVNKVVVNQGPRSDEVERVSGRKIQTVALKELRQHDEETVAEKNPNLRHQVVDRNPPAMERKPEPRQEVPPQNARNNNHEQPVATPVAQPVPQEQRKPLRKEQPQAQPVPAEFQQPVSRPETQPVDNRNNPERIQREQNPPNNPIREARQPERPVNQPQADANARERLPQHPPQAEVQQRPAQPERERQPVAPEQQRQNEKPSPSNSGNAQDRGNQDRNQHGQQDRNAGGRDNGKNNDDSGNQRN